MIIEQHNPLAVHFFNYYSRLMVKWYFRDLRYHSAAAIPKGPLLVLANHFSWWDGFLTVVHNQRYFKRKFHVLMLEDQLSRRRFLAKAGAFSIRKGSRSAINSLNYAAEILNNPDNMLLMFPQGSIQSHHQQHFTFEKGIEFIIKRCKVPPSLLFLAHLIDYHAGKKPVVHVYSSLLQNANQSASSLENHYNDFFKEAITKHLKEFEP